MARYHIANNGKSQFTKTGGGTLNNSSDNSITLSNATKFAGNTLAVLADNEDIKLATKTETVLITALSGADATLTRNADSEGIEEWEADSWIFILVRKEHIDEIWTELDLKEVSANKAENLTSPNHTKYPTVQAVVTELNTRDTSNRNRANHTGTQLAATVSDFQTTVSANTDVATNTTHRGLTTNPHTVTKAQVGLGNVDNTSDTNKPVSTATQTALDAKTNNSLISTSGTGIVVHGATAGTARPTGYAQVIWIGTVDPTNRALNDIWIDTTV